MVSKKKVLIVDDNPYVIVSARSVLEDAGYEVFAATSGEECLSFLEREHFQGVILMDLMMPKMDGWETIDEIVKRGLDKNVVISVLSAKDFPVEKPKQMDFIADYFVKPFNNEKIVKKLDSYFVYE